MTDLYNKIQDYLQVDKKDKVLISITKAAILLLCGAYLGLIIRELNATPQVFDMKHFAIFAGTLLVFIYLEIRRFSREKNFPVTILEHLKATEELKDLTNGYNRKLKIDEYIERSIQSLNSNTFPIVSDAEGALAHKDLKTGLQKVLIDLIEKPHYILDSSRSKFTFGIYIKEVYNPKSEVGSIEKNEQFFIFRDDLLLKDLMPARLYNITKKNEDQFLLQTSIIETLNFNKFVCKNIFINQKVHTIICSPLPNIFEDSPPDGAIFGVYEGVEYGPSDIENILLIFSRLASNWIYKFNDAVQREKRVITNGQYDPKVAIPGVLKL